ncbi:hypothetical protein KKH18_11420 [bacterium]|nr:hypothetical protein [bacterium]
MKDFIQYAQKFLEIANAARDFSFHYAAQRIQRTYEDNGYRDSIVTETEYALDWRLIREALSRYPTLETVFIQHFKTLSKAVWMYPLGEDGKFDHQSRFAVGSELTNVVLDCCKIFGTPKPTDIQLKQSYEEWYRIKNSDPQPAKVYCFLQNFESKIEDTSLGKDWKLEKITNTQRSILWNNFFHHMSEIGSFLSAETFHSATHRIILVDSRTKTAFKPVVTALRLLHEGNIGAEALISEPDEKYRMLAWGSSPLGELRSNYGGKKYILSTEDLGPLANILDLLEDTTNRKELEIAIRRFNISYTRQNIEDVIIDCTIGLESTLLRGFSDELIFRLALYGARLLSDTDKPEATYDILRTIYDIRSKIVHEGQLVGEQKKNINRLACKIEGFTIAMLPDLCRSIIRKVILKYLSRMKDSGESVKTINKHILESTISP